MSDFTIDPAVKAQLLADRITQLNLEGYNHELNKATAEAIGNQEAIVQADQAIAIIKTAITVAEQQLEG